MPGVLRPDDLGYLILVLNHIKCLNLNSIMPGILGPDDLGWLTLTLSSLKCLNLNLGMLLEITIWVILEL